MISKQHLWEKLNDLFSIIMILDQDLRIVRSSDTLLRYLPEAKGSPALRDIFDIKRPAFLSTFADLHNNTHSLFLMISHNKQFGVRGQVIDLGDEVDHYFCFTGFPWLSWMHSNRPEIDLSLADFRPLDAQMDQMFYISTESRMIDDLENLNLQLSAAQKRAESAQAEKDAFFAHLSHEMRTPLNGVVSAITLLKEQKLTGFTAELMELAEESSNNLMQVINYVLDISKMENSVVTPEQIPFDLRDLIDSLIRVVNARAIEKQLNLYSQFEKNMQETFLGDPSRIRQTLLNLVVNAINFTDHGEVSVKVCPPQHDGMTLRIEVSDTGIGIAKKDQAVIFEPFKTLSQAKPINRKPSTGLGLNIVRRNVEFMNGLIGVSSAPGVGSIFWLELPCPATSTDELPTASRDSGRDDLINFAGKVLLVDDNETNLMLGRLILQSMGLEVDTVATGEESVIRAQAGDYDIVLMDISMPGIDGFEATRRIREFCSAEQLPVVALSAYTSAVEKKLSIECGMNGYLSKPIDREQLNKTLSQWLKNRRIGTTGANGPMVDSSPSVFDQAAINDLARQIGRSNLTMVIDKFLEEVETRWKALKCATTNEEICRQAHTLAGTCRSFGLTSAADSFSQMEAMARTGDSPATPAQLATSGRALKSGVEALQAAMQSYQQ